MRKKKKKISSIWGAKKTSLPRGEKITMFYPTPASMPPPRKSNGALLSCPPLTLFLMFCNFLSNSTLIAGKKITRGNGNHWLIPIQSVRTTFFSAIVHWPLLWKSRQTCEILRARDCDLFSTPFLIYCFGTSRRQLGGNWCGSRQLGMLTWFSLIWSQFQFLVIIEFFWGGKRVYHALCIDPTGTRVAK